VHLFVKFPIFALEDLLVMFDFEKFGLGGFNECSLMGDDVFQGLNELSDFPSGHTACALCRSVAITTLRIVLYGIRDVLTFTLGPKP
jgi:hypothetical protein